MTGKIPLADVRVGSFLLDTLTVGMYENPLHCIREYVQNAYDSLLDGIAAGLVSIGDALIVVSISGTAKKQSLSIRDNGIGVPSAEVIDRLISVGNSRKSPAKHAGFRGIGRLAGLAYCSTLRFTTKAVDEEIETILEFDCPAARGMMQAGSDPKPIQEVIVQTVSRRTRPAPRGKSYMLIEMEHLTGHGTDFADLDELERYLSQYAPVDYAQEFDFVDVITAKAKEFGYALPAIPLQIKRGRDVRMLKKAFRKSILAAGQLSKVSGIETVGSKEHGWFGWFTITDFPGEIGDATQAGIRFRQKNIQVGTSLLLERIASMQEKSSSNRRLMRWVAGEIFITSPQVVPNARRDGFEDNPDWRAIEADMTGVVATIAKVVRASSSRRNAVDKIDKHVKQARRAIDARTEIGQSERQALDDDLDQQLEKIRKAHRVGADPDKLKALILEIERVRDRLRAIPASRPTFAPLLQKAMEIVREVLGEELSAIEARRIAEKIRRRLSKLDD